MGQNEKRACVDSEISPTKHIALSKYAPSKKKREVTECPKHVVKVYF